MILVPVSTDAGTALVLICDVIIYYSEVIYYLEKPSKRCKKRYNKIPSAVTRQTTHNYFLEPCLLLDNLQGNKSFNVLECLVVLHDTLRLVFRKGSLKQH